MREKLHSIFVMLAFIAAKKIGVRTTYLVCYRAPSIKGEIHGQVTVTVAPWISAHNLASVSSYLLEICQEHGATQAPVIISLNRIGREVEKP